MGETELGGKDKRRGVLREAENDGGGEKGSQTKRERCTRTKTSRIHFDFSIFFSLLCDAVRSQLPEGQRERQPERIKPRQREKVRGKVFLLSESEREHRERTSLSLPGRMTDDCL